MFQKGKLKKGKNNSEHSMILNDERVGFQRRFSWFIVSFLIIGIITGLVVFRYNESFQNIFYSADRSSEVVQQRVSQTEENLSLNSHTPMPFEEMTIPFLRELTYQSSLSELEYVSDTQAYTTYVTSYDSDRLRVNGLVTIPKGDMPLPGWPAIVFVHGYIPPHQYQTRGPQYVDYVDYLSQNGFVVFKIDLRGHGTSEGEPGGGYYSSDYIVDTLNAYAALQSSDFVNSSRIGLWGHSMSGNVLLRTMAVKPDIPALVIWAGAVYSYSDWQEYGISDGSYSRPPSTSERQRRRQELFDTHGEFSPESPFWQQVAGTNYLDDLQGAIQLHHAVDDEVVDIRYSRNLKNLLDQTPVPHELNEYPGGGHNISGIYFTQAMQRTVAFFQNHL